MGSPEDKKPKISVRIKETKTTEDLAPLVLKVGEFSIMSVEGGGTEITCLKNIAVSREKLAEALRERGYTVIEEE